MNYDPYITTPDIPAGMTIQAYRASRTEPMRPRHGVLKRATRAATRSARYEPRKDARP